MHADRVRPLLPPDARVETVWLWLIVVVPWILASSVFLFDVDAVLDALWVGDADAATAHVALHLGVLLAQSLLTIALDLLFAWRDARRLRAAGVVDPFPWGFAAVAGIVYVIGRLVVLRKVARPSVVPLVVSIGLYLLWYTTFAVWAVMSVSNALAGLGATTG